MEETAARAFSEGLLLWRKTCPHLEPDKGGFTHKMVSLDPK